MNEQELKDRTKRFALQIIRLVQSLPKSTTENVIGKQLLRAGTSVGANCRAACRGKLKADLTAKLKIVMEESDAAATGLNCSVIAVSGQKRNLSLYSKEQMN